jgi:hypothetical protein
MYILTHLNIFRWFLSDIMPAKADEPAEEEEHHLPEEEADL